MRMTGFDADILVVGGGPGGLAPRYTHARQGLSVIVAEPRDSPIDKACGEGLMPGGLAVLASLGVDPAGMPFRGIAYVDGRRRAEACFACRAWVAACGAPPCTPRWRHGPKRLTPNGFRTKVTYRCAGRRRGDGGRCAGAAIWWPPTDCIRRFAAPSESSLSPGHRGGSVCAGISGCRPWSEFVEVHWSPMGEAYVTPVEPDLVGVAILSRHRHDLAWFPWLARRLAGVAHGPERGCGPLRQVVSRRVAGRVLLVGDAAGYEDALTGEGMSLAVKQAGAAVAAIAADRPGDYERDWRPDHARATGC